MSGALPSTLYTLLMPLDRQHTAKPQNALGC